MKNILNKKFITILTIITLAVYIFSRLPKIQVATPKLLTSTPTQNALSVSLTNPIELKFDQNIDLSLLAISSTPSEVWTIEPGLDASLVILKSKQYFRVDTKYSLSIDYNGSQAAMLNFQTIAQQGDGRYTQEVINEMNRDYPLAAKTPFEKPGFRVVYSSPMTLEITLKNSILTSTEAIEEVKAWVTQNGGSASAHKYIIASPSPIPTN